MRVFKVMIVVSLFAVSCNRSETVTKAQYDDVVAEYEELRQSVSATREAYIKQAVQIDSILVEISRLSGKTAVIRTDVEKGSVRITQIQQIEDSIDGIRDRIEDLENHADENNGLKKIISGLKKMVEEKDEEIKTLKAQLKEKDKKINDQGKTIIEQSSTINTQMQTILHQKASLEKSVKTQAEMLYKAGLAFESLGDDTPEIKRKKDRAKVENLTKEMYENALNYYTQAYNSGYIAAEQKISQVQRKIRLL